MENSPNVTHRLREVIEEFSLNVNELERRIGAGNNTLRKAITESRSISSTWLQKISDIFPNINMHWLITGTGSKYYEGTLNEHAVEYMNSNAVKQLELEKLHQENYELLRENRAVAVRVRSIKKKCFDYY